MRSKLCCNNFKSIRLLVVVVVVVVIDGGVAGGVVGIGVVGRCNISQSRAFDVLLIPTVQTATTTLATEITLPSSNNARIEQDTS